MFKIVFKCESELRLQSMLDFHIIPLLNVKYNKWLVFFLSFSQDQSYITYFLIN